MSTENEINALIKRSVTPKKRKTKINTREAAIKEAEKNYSDAIASTEKKHWFTLLVNLRGWDKRSNKDTEAELKEETKRNLRLQHKYYLDLKKGIAWDVIFAIVPTNPH